MGRVGPGLPAWEPCRSRRNQVSPGRRQAARILPGNWGVCLTPPSYRVGCDVRLPPLKPIASARAQCTSVYIRNVNNPMRGTLDLQHFGSTRMHICAECARAAIPPHEHECLPDWWACVHSLVPHPKAWAQCCVLGVRRQALRWGLGHRFPSPLRWLLHLQMRPPLLMCGNARSGSVTCWDSLQRPS